MLVGQREKSQKYFDLSAFNKNLNDSNPGSSLRIMNFQTWELFSGSPGIVMEMTRSTVKMVACILVVCEILDSSP